MKLVSIFELMLIFRQETHGLKAFRKVENSAFSSFLKSIEFYIAMESTRRDEFKIENRTEIRAHLREFWPLKEQNGA